MTILQINTGLFPDTDTVRDGIAAAGAEVERVDVTAIDTNDQDGWDTVVQALMKADLVVTL